jgi:hypothetical protein
MNPNSAFAITKSNSTTFSPCILYVGGTGNLNVMPAVGASARLFKNVPAGTVLPLKVVQVFSSVTTCSSIIGMY